MRYSCRLTHVGPIRILLFWVVMSVFIIGLPTEKPYKGAKRQHFCGPCMGDEPGFSLSTQPHSSATPTYCGLT